ncbi:LRR receptor-like kinase [Melia azedarach]|uniref:LRR receptor-like kinase n=1 Tax=Melia azedarach TaxID=155640 RepID=A0ACC1WTS5_MELAZ|nr:LRR receptor-like kinase [Melia azedarach]
MGSLQLLITKIAVCLVIWFPLISQRGGSEFKFIQSAAAQPLEPATSPATSPAPSPAPSPKLNGDETDTLRWIVSNLDIAPELNIKESACDDEFGSSVTITCTDNTKTRHITGITINGARLTGEISIYVADLTYLKFLDLSNNKIGGSIPENLGTLPNLITLDLSKNQLTGKIPQNLGNLTKLQYLDLSENQLTGKIPQNLGKLKNLQKLFLYQNLLTEKIPATLGGLSSLLILNLAWNQLSGDIPPDLGDLFGLQRLALSNNELTGNPPSQLGNLSKLTSLWLISNNLEGELPKEYEKLINLKEFGVGGNNLSGHIPPYIAKWVELMELNLVGNNFEGELPQEILNMANLQYLLVSDLNNSGFPFPKTATLPRIYSLMLRNCNIIGEIPSYISVWSRRSLYYLDLSFNKLTGGLPDDLKGVPLNRLMLTGNMLNGTFPSWINNTVRMMGDLSYNNFTFPDEPHVDLDPTDSDQTNIINIEPRNSDFPRDIMDKHCGGKTSKYHSLFINAGGDEVTIGRNHFEADNSTSSFYVNKPAYNWAYSCNGDFFGKRTNSSDYIANATCGVSVNSEMAPLYSKARLCPQSLTYYGFCLHKGRYKVSLHFSEIIFSKDEDLSSSGKRVFDIYIQGKLERKDFNIKEVAGGPNEMLIENFEDVVVRDNKLEIRLFWNGKGSLFSPTPINGPLISAISVTPKFKVGGLSKLEIAGIVLAAVLAPLLIVALMWRLGWLGDRELRVNKVTLQGVPYTIKQVKDATRNFSSKNEVGKGRFGTVYKAELSDKMNKMTVAVKKLSPQSKHEIGQIGTEVYALKQLGENENVVKLLDCYSKKDLHLLIYEYMEKGSLQQALFDPNSDIQLDWPTRIGICLGIGKGLKYLHEDKKSHKIVHRNIKPSNVLLDGNLKAKVADFGLAKFYDEENPFKFIQEKGTAVYMAPEYGMRKAITVAVDVYSFGIVLLEIVSGQTNAAYDANQETVFLLDKAIVLNTKGRLFDLVDTNMPNINRNVRKQAIEVLELAIKCVDQSPTLRPTMSEVVSELEKISNVATTSA